MSDAIIHFGDWWSVQGQCTSDGVGVGVGPVLAGHKRQLVCRGSSSTTRPLGPCSSHVGQKTAWSLLSFHLLPALQISWSVEPVWSRPATWAVLCSQCFAHSALLTVLCSQCSAHSALLTPDANISISNSSCGEGDSCESISNEMEEVQINGSFRLVAATLFFYECFRR